MHNIYYRTRKEKSTMRVLIRIFKSKNDRTLLYEEVRKYKSTSLKCVNNRMQNLMRKYNGTYATADSIREETKES